MTSLTNSWGVFSTSEIHGGKSVKQRVSFKIKAHDSIIHRNRRFVLLKVLRILWHFQLHASVMRFYTISQLQLISMVLILFSWLQVSEITLANLTKTKFTWRKEVSYRVKRVIDVSSLERFRNQGRFRSPESKLIY